MKTEKEKMISGELYNAFSPDLVTERELARQKFTSLNNDDLTNDQKSSIYKELFGQCGEGTWIEPPFYCDYGSMISLGNNVFINFNCTILDCAPVTIGDNVLIGPNVNIYSANHPIDPEIRRKGLENAKPVLIEDDVWIGGNVTICPGVTIGSRTTIGAGSVVTKAIPSDVVAAGNPAKVIKKLEKSK